MTVLIAVLLIYSAIPQTQAGTYQIIVDRGQIIRIDTKSGAFEKCRMGETLVCTTIKEIAATQ